MDRTIHWLLEHAGPVIKYRVINEFCENISEQNRQEALFNLLEWPETKKRLSQLKCQDMDKIHGATLDCFENSLPMVLDFGIRKDVLESCGCIDVNRIIEHYETLADENPYHNSYKKIMYPILFKAGYQNSEIVNYLRKRIDVIFEFTCKMDFDIYDSIEKYKSLPKNYRDRPVVKRELFQDYDYVFPQIYDIIGFAEMYQVTTPEYQEKINNIINYIISPEYNKFAIHYGVIQLPNKRYSAVGWDCLLPLFYADCGHRSLSMYLHRLEMFSVFPCVVQSEWFQTALKRFDSCKTDHGTFILEKEFLTEKNHCWFLGEHMGLGESRRKNYQEAESTFRILKIMKNARLW